MTDSWNPLPWQDGLWRQMITRSQRDTLAHAYLMRGMPGVGKFQFARALAAYLLCKSPTQFQHCGHCKECELLKAGTHPDITIVEPDEPGRPIRIDKIRRLNEFAHKTAQQGGRRVIIMNPAEAMNMNAANALLKCLEEPGEDTLFLLVSARAGDMLPTIRSRCQQLMFPCPDRVSALNWLAQYLDEGISSGTLLDLVGGAPLEARRFAEQGVLDKRQGLIKGVKGLLKGEHSPVELAKEWQGDDLVLTLSWLGSWLDDAVKVSLAGSDASGLRNQDLLKMLGYIAGKSPSRRILEARDWLIKQRQSLLEGGNLNVQMLMEGVFCRYLDLVV